MSMKLTKLKARSYRSLREEEIQLTDLNLFIGANASGKSTILDALRFLHEGLRERDFRPPVYSRGGIVHLAWKGEVARRIELVVDFEGDGKKYEWSIQLEREDYSFTVREYLTEIADTLPPTIRPLLTANRGKGTWWSGDKEVQLDQAATGCALASAAADALFPARNVAEFVSRWGFFDPSPFLLRRGWTGLDASRLDSHGRNLAERLLSMSGDSPDTLKQVLSATQSVLGLPTNIELRESRDTEDRAYFVQHEPGLTFPVHQVGVSSGTLRMLALMTALFGETDSNLIGIEEPENYVHPAALASFAEYLLKARERTQLLVTTHSPFLLDLLDEPEAVCVVRRTDEKGTQVMRERDAEGVRQALDASGFGLGEFHETKGFGG